MEFFSEGLSPPKPPRGCGTVWQNFSLLFNAIDSEKYLGCASGFQTVVRVPVVLRECLLSSTRIDLLSVFIRKKYIL